jgi:hypothetical protein
LITPNPIEYNYRPQSVAIGDFNNDTWLDLVVANFAADSIAIFLGFGNGSVNRPMIYSTGSGSAPCMVAVGDFNNDHRLDIAVANYGIHNVGIFLGFGNSACPLWVLVADFNNDTVLDIVTVNYGTNSISIFYGNGDGSFSQPHTYSTGYDSIPFMVVVGDFNNDKQMDLAIANYGTNNVGILLGINNSTFSNQTAFSTGSYSDPYSIVVGYLNDDDLLDIAVGNHGSNSITILIG